MKLSKTKPQVSCSLHKTIHKEMFPNVENYDRIRDYKPEAEIHLQRTLASYLTKKMNKSAFVNELVQGQRPNATEDHQFNVLLLELLKRQRSETSKGLLEQFASYQLQESLLKSQRVMQTEPHQQIMMPQRLDRSVSEPAPQQSLVKKLVNQTRYKTELCRQFEEKGHCQYGDKCQFAHGPNDKRYVERHPKYKTEMCRTFHEQGFCSYGLRCNFIHNEDERRIALVEEPHKNGSLTRGRMISPLPLFQGQLSLNNSQSSDSSDQSSLHELTHSMSVGCDSHQTPFVEYPSESSIFSNEFNISLGLQELIIGSSIQRATCFQSTIGPGESVLSKDQHFRGRPILSRSLSTAVHLQFSEDNI